MNTNLEGEGYSWYLVADIISAINFVYSAASLQRSCRQSPSLPRDPLQALRICHGHAEDPLSNAQPQ